MSLRQSLSTLEGKQQYVRRLFATIADRYDFITRFLSYGQDQRWKRRLLELARLDSSDRLLDLACGTGDLTFAASRCVQFIVGLDVTFRMLQLARERGPAPLKRSPTYVGHPFTGCLFIAGDILALPFPDRTFTVVTTGYGLRNVPQLEQALNEIRRVLAPGGRFLSLDFDRPTNAIVRSVYLVYLTIVGSTLGFVLHGDPDTYRYIPESIRRYPGARGVAGVMERHGFTDVRVESVLGGLMAIHTATVPATAPAPAR